jgi:hypothetical protein
MSWKVPRHLTALQKIGDAQSWAIELGTSGIAPSSVPDVVLEINTFRLLPPTTPREMPAKYIPHYTVDCRTLFHHPVLKYSYTGRKDMETYYYRQAQ